MSSDRAFPSVSYSMAKLTTIKAAYPDGPPDVNGDPVPSAEVPNAAVVLKVLDLQGYSKASFTYGSYGANGNVTKLQPPPSTGTLLVVPGQRLTFTLAPSDSDEEGAMTIQTGLVGDFCHEFPTEKLCTEKTYDTTTTTAPATSPPEPSPEDSSSPDDKSAASVGNSTSAPNATSSAPVPSAPKSMSARRVVLSSLVACLAIASTAF